jgi:hypothetical protein
VPVLNCFRGLAPRRCCFAGWIRHEPIMRGATAGCNAKMQNGAK